MKYILDNGITYDSELDGPVNRAVPYVQFVTLTRMGVAEESIAGLVSFLTPADVHEFCQESVNLGFGMPDSETLQIISRQKIVVVEPSAALPYDEGCGGECCAD